MFANLKPALIITRREVRDQFRDWRIIIPIIVLTLFFPLLMNFTADLVINFVQRYDARIIGDRLIPFLLMIVGFFPISVSLVIALESFVGEKERHSIEPLLSSPLTDWQLYVGKLLASVIPPLIASFIGIAVYLFSVYMQVGWKPDLILLVQILALTTVQALVMVSGAVVISSLATSVRAANLLASFIIIPMALLIQAESIMMFWARYEILWLVIFGQIIIAALLVRAGISHFNREELLGREMDTLNIKWMWQTFWKMFTGNARSPLDWYQREISETLNRIRIPLILMTLVLITATLIGACYASTNALPVELFNTSDMGKNLFQGMEVLRFFSLEGVSWVWLHNLRAISLATLMGIFSFGVLGVVLLLTPLAMVGYFSAIVAQTGVSPVLFITGFVLPHGILEIPAIILAGAAILHMGATLIAPSNQHTIGEIWLRGFADWAKIMLALVIPLLLGAATLEVFLTPTIAMFLLGR